MKKFFRICLYLGIVLLLFYFLGAYNIPLPDDGWDPMAAFHIDSFHKFPVIIAAVLLVAIPLFITWREKKREKKNQLDSFLKGV